MKSAKNLLVPFIIFIALVLCVIVYFAVELVKKNESEQTSAGLINVVYINPGDISSISVYNRDTGINSVVNCSMMSNGSQSYDYKGDDAEDGEKYSQSGLYSYVEALSSFSCNTMIKSPGALSEYGLDNPRFTININSVSGTVTTVYIGNNTPDGAYCYIYVAGSGDIYTVTVTKIIQAEKNALDFLDSTVLSIQYSDLSTVHFDRTSDNLSLDANVRLTDSGIADFDFYKPYSHAASPYFGTLMDKLVELEISEYVDIKESELAKYGLKDPAFHIVFNMKNGDSTEFFFSNKTEGFYYGYMTGFDKYFKVYERQVEGIELQETVLIDPYVCYCYAKNLSSITGTYGDKTFKFGLSVADGDSITSEASTVTLDGRNAKISDPDGRSFCSILFESIACIKIGGIENDA
ncbi:MAG: DUF4340 domain-containing protein, partial [Eubacterium sp.]|nr:DUF4340 domain-containing protein [Eubacterium sp.]